MVSSSVCVHLPELAGTATCKHPFALQSYQVNAPQLSASFCLASAEQTFI